MPQENGETDENAEVISISNGNSHSAALLSEIQDFLLNVRSTNACALFPSCSPSIWEGGSAYCISLLCRQWHGADMGAWRGRTTR